MGSRFFKSVKISKGMKLNFSKRGVSASFGIPGFSFTTGRKGSYINTGIPGTGLSYRTKLTGSSKKTSPHSQKTSSYRSTQHQTTPKTQQSVNISIQHYDDGTYAFFTPDGTKITDEAIISKIKSTQAFRESARKAKEDLKNHNAQKVDEYNSAAQEVIDVYKHTTDLLSLSEFSNCLLGLKPKTYQKLDFAESPPSSELLRETLQKEAETQFTTILPWKIPAIKKQQAEYVNTNFSTRFNIMMNAWEKRKTKFLEEQDKLEAENNALYQDEYENEKSALEAAICGDECYIDIAIEQWLDSVELPLGFSVDYQYSTTSKILAIDIDLPEIEDIPHQKAKQLANGTIKIVDKTQKEVYADYCECVFGIAAFFTSYMANVSPAIETILISGYTQRRNNKTGELQNEYIYSIIFTRSAFNENKAFATTAKDFCISFKNQ